MPIFTMLVGLPLSGKSEYAESLSAKTGAVHIASDAIRQELFGSENTMTHQHKVFQELHRRVKAELKAGRDVIYDATNINYRRRMAFLQELTNIPCEKVCVLFVTPYHECLRRNEIRERKIPESVVERMLRKFWIPQYYEGWDKIIIEGVEHSTIQALFNHGDENSPTPLNQFDQATPHHAFTVGHHCLTTQANLVSSNKKVPKELEMAALLHDIGKPFTKSFTNKRGEEKPYALYYDHHNVSAYMSFSYVDPDEYDSLRVANFIQWHMRTFMIARTDDRKKANEKFKKLVGISAYRHIMRLHRADRTSKGV